VADTAATALIEVKFVVAGTVGFLLVIPDPYLIACFCA
jgi:hypothetical protein